MVFITYGPVKMNTAESIVQRKIPGQADLPRDQQLSVRSMKAFLGRKIVVFV